MFEFFLGLVFLGIFAGLLSGFFGIGSGVILVPAYVFLFNLLDLPPEIIPILATGTSMTTMAITIPMAAYVHFKNNNVELEIVKKMFLQGKPATEENIFHMKRELGDIIWYWATACMALNLDPYEVISENKSKLEARYGKGFKVEKSEHRKKGDL